MPEHGGKRNGSGRNPLPEYQKKAATTIYVTPTLHDEIEKYAEGNSFSEKCIDLICAQIERRKRAANKEVNFIDLFIMGPLSRPRSKILRVAVSRIILSSEASKVKLVGNLVA